MAYTDEEKQAALTLLEANGGNLKRTARETGVTTPTLRAWREEGKIKPSPEKAAALVDSYLEKAKRVREALLDRLAELAPKETDMFKVAGAFKTVAEAAASEEVDRALTIRLRTAQSSAAQPHEADRAVGSPGASDYN